MYKTVLGIEKFKNMRQKVCTKYKRMTFVSSSFGLKMNSKITKIRNIGLLNHCSSLFML